MAFYDINVDGSWDIKISVPQKEVYVWLQGEWRGVKRHLGDEDHRALLDGRDVVFDRTSGLWKMVGEE